MRFTKIVDEVMPVAFSIVKETARRFAENEETVVTATDFDRELQESHPTISLLLMVTKPFITIIGLLEVMT